MSKESSQLYVVEEPPPEPQRKTEPRRWRAGDEVSGKYRLLRERGRGGIAAVWVAQNMALEVDVALKLIPLEDTSPRRADRLLQEARAAARLRHSAIVQINDFGQTDQGDPFIVMELLEGETLADLMRREGKLPPARAVQLLLPIAEGLSVAQGQGVVHRDLKPANIVLERRSSGRLQPKLVDFGLAKLRDGNRKLTEDGTVLGSPDYMSPEQVIGEVAGHRADIWAFCVVLYEMLSGNLPFRAKHQFGLFKAIMESDPEPLGAEHAALWPLIQKGLRRAPEDRWSSIKELGRLLARWLLDQGVEADASSTQLREIWIDDDGLSAAPPAPSSAAASSLAAAGASPTSQGLRARYRWRYLAVAVGALALVVAAWWMASAWSDSVPAAAPVVPTEARSVPVPGVASSPKALQPDAAVSEPAAPATGSSSAERSQQPPEAPASTGRDPGSSGKPSSGKPSSGKPSSGKPSSGKPKWTEAEEDDVGL